MSAPYSPSRFFPELFRAQHGLCAWCGTALPESTSGYGQVMRGAAVVDHNHRCCPLGRTCGNCVRGAVCQSCNLTHIRYADWAYENGLKLPKWMHRYITQGEGLIDGKRVVSFEDLSEKVATPDIGLSVVNDLLEKDLRSRYPYLFMVKVDGWREYQVARMRKVHRRTIQNRLVEEKLRAAKDPDMLEYLGR